MTLDDLFDEYREESGDSGTPPFVSDTWLTKRANEAEREACQGWPADSNPYMQCVRYR